MKVTVNATRRLKMRQDEWVNEWKQKELADERVCCAAEAATSAGGGCSLCTVAINWNI